MGRPTSGFRRRYRHCWLEVSLGRLGGAAVAPPPEGADRASGWRPIRLLAVAREVLCTSSSSGSPTPKENAHEDAVDLCAGAVDLRARNIQLERIDQSVDAAAQRIFLLVFNVSRVENSAPGHLNSMRQYGQ